MERSHLIGVLCTVAFTIISMSSHSALIPKLNGQVVYDDDRDITWVANANLAGSNTFGLVPHAFLGTHPSDSSGELGVITADGVMNWPGALFWIDAMNAANYLGFNDWRLPTTLQPDANCTTQGSFGSRHANCTGSEMGHLYYDEFKATPVTGGDITELTKFTNIISLSFTGYWSGTELDSTYAWFFAFNDGIQNAVAKAAGRYVWAVRSGDINDVPPVSDPPGLVGRLPATPGGTDYQAYYDPGLNITWLADANTVGTKAWQSAQDWAASLNISGVTGWRLPSADVDGDGTVIDCSIGSVFAISCADNEMGFLYWQEGITAFTPGPFSNIQSNDSYWYGTEDGGSAWNFNFNGGDKHSGNKLLSQYAWAVHSGDVTAPKEVELIDPNPDLIKPTSPLFGDFTNAGFYEDLAYDQARIVDGLAADGVTPLLLRLEVPGDGSVTFSIADNDDSNNTQDVGNLSGVEDPCAPPWVTQSCSTDAGFGYILSPQTTLPGIISRQLSDGRYMVFAVLTAPIDFTRSSADNSLDKRLIKLTAEFTPSDGNPTSFTQVKLIELHRPPVMLLHGLWSFADTWVWGLEDDSRFTVHPQDYYFMNARFFEQNLHFPKAGINSALRKIKKKHNIAATQADVFGHSMGGLLTRLYVAEQAGAIYKRPDNLMAGDVHKLVTVDTPHLGSPIADLLVDNNNSLRLAGRAVQNIHDAFPDLAGCVTCGALRDLRTDSPIISQMPQADVWAHAIIGVGGSVIEEVGVSAVSGALTLAGDIVPNPLVKGYVNSIGAVWDATWFVIRESPFHDLHDLVVSRNSQIGDLPPTAITEFNYISSDEPAIHVTVTMEERISQRAIELLNARLEGVSVFEPHYPGSAQVLPQLQSQSFATVASVAAPASVSDLVITAPTPGTVVSPRDEITVTVEGINGYVPTSVLIMSNYGSTVAESEPFNIPFTIQQEALGPLMLWAYAYDANGVLAESQPITLSVQSSASLSSIRAASTSFELSNLIPQQPVIVVGQYSDGVERNISAPSFGTTYNVRDTSIAKIDSNGSLTALAQGETILDIYNGALQTQVPITVLDDVDGDGDGVPNSLDQCPGTPSGAIIDDRGCVTTVVPAPAEVLLFATVLMGLLVIGMARRKEAA